MSEEIIPYVEDRKRELLVKLDEIRARNELMPFDHQTQIDFLRVKRELREGEKESAP